ncbi:MAG: hypothetical protein HW387_1798 [Parachlamydiales bacterium]|nr:hypothetical protein [Parachlamydiales bacterium]
MTSPVANSGNNLVSFQHEPTVYLPVDDRRSTHLFQQYETDKPSLDTNTKLERLTEIYFVAKSEGKVADQKIDRLRYEMKCINDEQSLASKAQVKKIAIIAGASLGILAGGVAMGALVYIGAVPAGTIVTTYVGEFSVPFTYAMTASIPAQVAGAAAAGGVIIGGPLGLIAGAIYSDDIESGAVVPSFNTRSDNFLSMLNDTSTGKIKA